jgi:hypothetical protein
LVAADGTWERVHAALVADADAAGMIDWDVSVDSTVNRLHRHATNTGRATSPARCVRPPAYGPRSSTIER